MKSEPVDPPTSLVANKYEIVRLIGRGGMGAVWEGRHTTLGTRVAVKFIDSEFADRPDVQKRFETEAKAAATIQSKHAIQIYDHGIGDDGRPYIVMEYLEGEPLDARLNRVGTMDLPTITRILQQVSRALARAHERNIVHRDLKPENIFLVQTLEDDEEVAKVLDFGIAKIVGDQAGPLTGATKTGAILGTPFYMSPEQARGLKEVDHRADVWSLGVIAYRAVLGKLPFDGQSVGDLLVNICTADPAPPSALRSGLPAAFDGWIQKSLARSLDDRFTNVAEQMEALAFAAGVTVRKPISSANGPAASAVLSHRTLPLGAALSTPLPTPRTSPPISDGTPLPAGAVTSTGLTTSLGQPSQTRGLWTVIGVATVLLLLGGGASALLLLNRDEVPHAASAVAVTVSAVEQPPAPSAAPLVSLSTAAPLAEPPPEEKKDDETKGAGKPAGGGKATKPTGKTSGKGEPSAEAKPDNKPEPPAPAPAPKPGKSDPWGF